MTDTIASYLSQDHRRCDHLLAECETAITKKAWQDAGVATAAFRDALLHHFLLEEEVLFPELEEANPVANGPTGIMRMEHQQMRQLLDELAGAVDGRDRDTCLGDLETLHMLSQQHNAKEEAILYPMADNTFGKDADSMTARLRTA